MIDHGTDGSNREQILKLLDREVADSNGFGEAKFLALFHGFPHTLHIERQEILYLNRKGELPWLRTEGPVDEI